MMDHVERNTKVKCYMGIVCNAEEVFYFRKYLITGSKER